MIRYRYNHQVNPPAPFIHVTLQRPGGVESVGDVPAQLDTAADITVVPLNLIERLRLLQFDAIPACAFDGILKTVPTFLVHLSLRGHDPVAVEVLGSANEPHVLLGRDLLNRHRIVLDGPRSVLEID